MTKFILQLPKHNGKFNIVRCGLLLQLHRKNSYKRMWAIFYINCFITLQKLISRVKNES
jgi:hypothetical protein